jgi:hypothetical protein
MSIMMSNLDTPNSRFSPLQKLWIGLLASVILLILIVWIYYAEPLAQSASVFWSSNLVDILILIPAIGAAIAGTLVTSQFDKGETPHRIWRAFAIGLWFWVAGEISGIVYNTIYFDTDFPDLTLIDLSWLLGYFFLGLSLYYQFRLVYGTQVRKGRMLYLGLFALALLVTAGLTELAVNAGLGEGYAWIVLFITVLYPVFDLTEGTLAIWLSVLFRRGQWSRPWWGLILFALADSVNSFYWLGGYDLISVRAQGVLDFISLVAYPASYIAAGLALLSNYFILRYGKDSGLMKSVKTSEINKPEI